MADELDYKKDVEIDKYRLDEETSTHGTKFIRWVKELARLNHELKTLKERILVYRAELGNKIRLHPNKYGLDKITENAVASVIDVDSDFGKLKVEQFQLEEDIDICKGVVDEIGGQRFLFEPLIRLYLASYYADTPIEGRKSDEEIAASRRTEERLRGTKKNG